MWKRSLCTRNKIKIEDKYMMYFEKVNESEIFAYIVPMKGNKMSSGIEKVPTF